MALTNSKKRYDCGFKYFIVIFYYLLLLIIITVAILFNIDHIRVGLGNISIYCQCRNIEVCNN